MFSPLFDTSLPYLGWQHGTYDGLAVRLHRNCASLVRGRGKQADNEQRKCEGKDHTRTQLVKGENVKTLLGASSSCNFSSFLHVRRLRSRATFVFIGRRMRKVWYSVLDFFYEPVNPFSSETGRYLILFILLMWLFEIFSSKFLSWYLFIFLYISLFRQ